MNIHIASRHIIFSQEKINEFLTKRGYYIEIHDTPVAGIGIFNLINKKKNKLIVQTASRHFAIPSGESFDKTKHKEAKIVFELIINEEIDTFINFFKHFTAGPY